MCPQVKAKGKRSPYRDLPVTEHLLTGCLQPRAGLEAMPDVPVSEPDAPVSGNSSPR